MLCGAPASFTALIERIHSKFMNKLQALYQSRFSFTLVECCKFRTTVQILKSIHQKLPSYLHNNYINIIPEMSQVILVETLIDALFLE